MRNFEDNRNNNKDRNKNSFRDMILIIFVVLICFGITIYGIAYLTGKVFSSDENQALVAQSNEKDVTTNPKEEGETITFTSIDETANEVAPVEEKTEEESTENDELVAAFESNFSDNNQNELNVADVKKEEPKKIEQKIEQKPVQKEVKKEAPVAPKKEEPVKEEVKKTAPVPLKKEVKEPNFVVQVVSLDSEDGAKKEVNKIKKHFPDAYYIKATVNGDTKYRVRMGKSETRAEAEKYLKAYEAKFGIKGFIAAVK